MLRGANLKSLMREAKGKDRSERQDRDADRRGDGSDKTKRGRSQSATYGGKSNHTLTPSMMKSSSGKQQLILQQQLLQQQQQPTDQIQTQCNLLPKYQQMLQQRQTNQIRFPNNLQHQSQAQTPPQSLSQPSSPKRSSSHSPQPSPQGGLNQHQAQSQSQPRVRLGGRLIRSKSEEEVQEFQRGLHSRPLKTRSLGEGKSGELTKAVAAALEEERNKTARSSSIGSKEKRDVVRLRRAGRLSTEVGGRRVPTTDTPSEDGSDSPTMTVMRDGVVYRVSTELREMLFESPPKPPKTPSSAPTDFRLLLTQNTSGMEDIRKNQARKPLSPFPNLGSSSKEVLLPEEHGAYTEFDEVDESSEDVARNRSGTYRSNSGKSKNHSNHVKRSHKNAQRSPKLLSPTTTHLTPQDRRRHFFHPPSEEDGLEEYVELLHEDKASGSTVDTFTGSPLSNQSYGHMGSSLRSTHSHVTHNRRTTRGNSAKSGSVNPMTTLTEPAEGISLPTGRTATPSHAKSSRRPKHASEPRYSSRIKKGADDIRGFKLDIGEGEGGKKLSPAAFKRRSQKSQSHFNPDGTPKRYYQPGRNRSGSGDGIVLPGEQHHLMAHSRPKSSFLSQLQPTRPELSSPKPSQSQSHPPIHHQSPSQPALQRQMSSDTSQGLDFNLPAIRRAVDTATDYLDGESVESEG